METPISNLKSILNGSDVIMTALDAGKKLRQKVYLVGGTIRDLIMNSAMGFDYDFVVIGEGIPFARSFAEKINGSFFILDEERDTSRVITKDGFQADFSGIRGDIEEDLMRRDFTINSMAIPLDSIHEDALLLDPLGGLTDIKNRVLKASSPASLKDDPLRILRAFRFFSSLSFSLDTQLMDLIRKDADGLRNVSAERVRAEIFMILDMPGAYKAFRGIDEAGVLKLLFPELEKWKGFYQGGWHVHDLFDHSMKTVESVEEVLSKLTIYFPKYGEKMERHFREEMEAYVTRRGIVKLASLLHDSGKLYTRVMEDGRGRFLGHEKVGEKISSDIAKMLKLSRRSEGILRGLTANHMRILALSKIKKITKRAKFRLFRDTDGFGLDLLVLSLADAVATPIKGEKYEEIKRITDVLAGYYFDEFMTAPPMPLLTGGDIITIFGIPEGKKVGEMLKLLREAESIGKVSNKREAVAYLKKVAAKDAVPLQAMRK